MQFNTNNFFNKTIPPLLKMNNKCPICFDDLIKKTRASPDICDHIFCFPCLEKWSKHGSYCPVDRKRFRKIVDLDSETVIQIKPCRPKQTRVLYDITMYCEVCKKANNASTLLLCDCCDLGYHCKCLQPPLQEVPSGVWHCPVCVAVDTRIKKSKDPKAVQNENAAQSNKEDLPSESSQGIFSPQTNYFKSEGIASIQEQSSGNRTESASLMKSNPRSYANDETIMSADKFLVSENKADKSIKIDNLIAATSNVKDNLTTQISIISEVKNNHRKNISSWSRRLRNRDPGLKSKETVTYCSVTVQSDRKQEQKYINNETIMSGDNSLVNETKVGENVKMNNLSAATSNVKDSLTPQINIKNTVQRKHQENSIWSRRLRKKDPESNETITYFSVTGQSDSLQEQHDKNELRATDCLVKDEQINICPLSKIFDFNNNSVKREGINNFKTESNSSSMKLRNKGSILTSSKGKSYSRTSLEKIKQNISSSCPSEENSLRIQNNGVFNEIQEKHKNVIQSNNLSNSSRQSISNANKGLQLHEPEISNSDTMFSIQKYSKCSKNASKSSKYGSEFSKKQSKATRRSVRNIYDKNKDNVCILSVNPEIIKKKRNLRVQIKDSEGAMNLNTDVLNSPDIVACSPKYINEDMAPKLRMKEKQPIRKNYKRLTTEEGLNKINGDPYITLQERKVNNAKIETNFENTKWCIHYCQKPDNYPGPCLKKGNSLKSENFGNKEQFPIFQTNVARNKSIIRITAEDWQKNNVIVTSQNKKEYCRNVQSIFVDVKNDIPFVDSDISISETPIYKVSDESEKRGTFLSLDNSNSSLTKESEKYKLNTNSCLPIDETGVLIHPESSDSAKYYFITKKSISNFAMEKLSLLASEKNEEKIMNEMRYKWYHIEEQDSAICNKEVLEKNIETTAVTATTEEPFYLKKPQHVSYHIVEQDTAISNNEVFEKSIQSTAVTITALSAATEKYEEPSSKKKPRRGWYHKEEQDSAVCNSDIPEMNINSTLFTTLSSTTEEITKDKTRQSTCHEEKEDTAIHNNVSKKSIYSTISTALSATSKKNEESSKDKTGQSLCHKEKKDPAICNVSETSIYSTICTATPKKYEPSKNKTGQGWYHYEDQEPAISSSKISETSIPSKIVPEKKEAGSQKNTSCTNTTKLKMYTLKNALHTSDNISNFKCFKQDPITPSPKFSVFESVDGTCISRQKYLSMNKSFTDTSLSSKNTPSLFANTLKGNQSDMTPCVVETASSATNPPRSYRSREVHYAIKAKMNLADELLKIEREKWPQHLKKYKYRRSSCSKYPKKRNRDACGSEIKKK